MCLHTGHTEDVNRLKSDSASGVCMFSNVGCGSPSNCLPEIPLATSPCEFIQEPNFEIPISKEKRRRTLIQKCKLRNLSNWYYDHAQRMRNLELMKYFISNMRENGCSIDCEELNKFFEENGMFQSQGEKIRKIPSKYRLKLLKSETDLTEDGIKLQLPENTKKHEKDETKLEDDDSYFEAYKKLIIQALRHYKMGLYGFNKTVNEQMELLHKRLKKMTKNNEIRETYDSKELYKGSMRSKLKNKKTKKEKGNRESSKGKKGKKGKKKGKKKKSKKKKPSKPEPIIQIPYKPKPKPSFLEVTADPDVFKYHCYPTSCWCKKRTSKLLLIDSPPKCGFKTSCIWKRPIPLNKISSFCINKRPVKKINSTHMLLVQPKKCRSSTFDCNLYLKSLGIIKRKECIT